MRFAYIKCACVLDTTTFIVEERLVFDESHTLALDLSRKVSHISCPLVRRSDARWLYAPGLLWIVSNMNPATLKAGIWDGQLCIVRYVSRSADLFGDA